MAKDSTEKSVQFCGLASYYRELSLLQIKYEHLTDVCSALLRSWSIDDTADVLEGPNPPSDIADKILEPTTSSEPEINPELQALELVLSKAHKVRAECTTAAVKPVQQQPKVSFAASMKLATSVYNPSGKKTHPTRTHSHKKKSCEVPGKKQRCTLPAIVPAPISKVTTSPPKAAASSLSATKGGSKIKEKGHVPAQEKENRHTLRTYGAQLFMPSSYCDLQKRFSRISGRINSMSCSSSDLAIEQFVQRLTQRSDGQASEVAHLQLLREGYTILKDQLSSQAPDSGTLQEVKQQLNLIKLHYRTTKDADAPAAGVPLSEPNAIAAGVPVYTHFSQSNTIAAGVPFSLPNAIEYSSTKEWLEMARCEHKRQLQHLELEIIKVCKEHLLPKLSSFQHDDVFFTETKRLLRTVLGLDAKPTISEE